MEPVYTEFAVSIEALKQSPNKVLAQANGQPIALLEGDHTVAYLVPAALYGRWMACLEDQELVALAKRRLKEKNQAIPTKLDDL